MSEKHYSEVHEIPLLNWEKCLEGKYQFMRRKPAKKFDTGDIKAFYTLYNNYIEKYGLSKEQAKYLKLQEDYIKLWIKYAETDDAFLINKLTMLEQDLAKAKPTNHKGMTIGQTVTWLSKWLGSWFDKRTRTLEEFKDLIQEYERANKKE